jgi:hypothetical protein
VSSPRKSRASLTSLRTFALLLTAVLAFLALATVGSARPQTTNPGGYFTIRVVITSKGATLSPTHARRGQIGIFLVSNHTSGPRVFTLGDVTLTRHRGTGFAVKLAANQQKRVLLTLDYRGPLPAAVVAGGKTKVVGAFIIT